MKISLDTESSELLKTLDVLGMPAFIVDRVWTILSCNDAVPAFFEYTRTDVIGRNLEQFLSLDALFRVRDSSKPASAGGAEGMPSSSIRSYCFRKNSSSVMCHIATVPNRLSRPDHTVVVIRDAPGFSMVPHRESTDVQEPAAPMEKSSPMELINELNGIINSSLSIGTIFRMVVTELKKIIHYDRASLLLYREQEDKLLIFALDTDMRTMMKKGVHAPIESTSAGWVVRNNRPWISTDLAQSPFVHDRKLYEEGIRSTISIPLFHDRILGVFNFDCTDIGRYSERDLDLLLPVAKQIAVALENALLFEEISREKKEWERTFDAITDMVWIEDGNQKVIRSNNALMLKTGFSKIEMGEKLCDEVLEKIGIARQDGCLCDETLSCRSPSFRELKSDSGSIFHFWAYPLIDEDGRLYAIVHYLKDVSERKRIEQQLIRSDKLASLGTLVAGIAHEINNPLGIIAAYAEALMDRANDPALRGKESFTDFPEYLKTIHSEIFRCKNILKSLLEFARPSSGTFREIDINELIKEVLLLLQHRTQRLKHSIELRLDRDVPKIYADAGSLRQLMMNLLLNAIYFTPEGGSITIETRAERGPGEPRLKGCEHRVRLSVSDTGRGIQEDAINKVFDPFFTTKPVGEGTGLGLTISYRIVEQHGGVIDVESKPGKGATFVIKLPSLACRES